MKVKEHLKSVGIKSSKFLKLVDWVSIFNQTFLQSQVMAFKCKILC